MPVTNLHIELRASRQLKTLSPPLYVHIASVANKNYGKFVSVLYLIENFLIDWPVGLKLWVSA